MPTRSTIAQQVKSLTFGKRVNIEAHKSPNQRGPVLKTICRCGTIGKVHTIKSYANGCNILFKKKKSHLKSHITSILYPLD